MQLMNKGPARFHALGMRLSWNDWGTLSLLTTALRLHPRSRVMEPEMDPRFGSRVCIDPPRD